MNRTRHHQRNTKAYQVGSYDLTRLLLVWLVAGLLAVGGCMDQPGNDTQQGSDSVQASLNGKGKQKEPDLSILAGRAPYARAFIPTGDPEDIGQRRGRRITVDGAVAKRIFHRRY